MTTSDDARRLPSLVPTIVFELALGGLALGVARVAGFWHPAEWSLVGMPFHAQTPTALLQGIGWGVLATLPMFLWLWLSNHLPLDAFRDLDRLVDETLVPMFSGHSLLGLALASFSAGLGEELLFRWTIQTGFAEGLDPAHGWWIGLLIASAVFGLMHWLSTAYAVVATGIGLYLGLVLLWTESLPAVVTTHALYDFVILVYLTRFRKPRTSSAD